VKPDALADQAREWLLRLRFEEADDDTMAEWEAWLAQPGARAAYDLTLNAWSLAGLADAHRPSGLQIATDRYDPGVSVRDWRQRQAPRGVRIARMAAGLAAAALLGLGGAAWWNASGDEPRQTFATRRAEHRGAELSDGSKIELAAMTNLAVSFDRRRRAIEVARGEAMFQVAKDASRPFVVSTPRGQFTAVGTAFNVDIAGDEVELYVTEGVVSASPAPRPGQSEPAPVRVAAGQRLVIRGSGPTLVLYEGAAAPARQWQEGRLEYREASLQSVIDDVNRYTHRPIVLDNPELGKLTYTGTVILSAADTWAYGLVGAFPVAVEQDDDRLILKADTKGKRTNM
jgi:transmembrane sensor